MNITRREMLRVSAVVSLMAAAGLIGEAQAAEWNKAAFEGKSVNDVIKALGGGSPEKSGAIAFNAPDIAENGAVVPVAVTSNLPDTEQIAILVEKNPNTLAADFVIPAGTEPFVSTRVKMGQTSVVHAAVKAGGKWYVASKEIKVTLGGCGG
ncbi:MULTISPECIES: thiosulfate oxidation carrier protein SoxY [Cupriavidus]|uniref:thiosulfate oxidation carrier protein SoxY n=1 Tax=Cupriavidus TaxID=106589 RepID=UPI0002915272|nr:MULTISPECIES: thiosulfate oxidation carrier protein SoxY [Cupriavidus]MCD9122047.1 thiosulfate oxidation carrier protein SoxY [Cupriavidus sp. UGS-1]